MSKTVLVTGGTGHIGVNLVPVLLAMDDVNLTVAVRERSPDKLLPNPAKTVETTFEDTDSLHSALAGQDVVVHLARAGVDGIQRLASAADAQDVTKIVFTSTIMAHPDLTPPVRTDYIDRKTQAQQVLADGDWSFDVTVLHPTYVVGPKDYRLARFRPFGQVTSNIVLIPPMYLQGKLNIVHVDDVVDTIVHCLSTETSERYIVSGENMRKRAVHRCIGKCSDRRSWNPPIPGVFIRNLIAPTVDMLFKAGIAPISGDEFRTGVFLGWVPSDYEYKAPVQNRTASRAIRDAFDWYDQAGLV